MGTLTLMGLTLMGERQSAQMSKITNCGLTRSGRGCLLYSYMLMAPLGVKGLMFGHVQS